MMETIYNQIIKRLEKELNMENNENIIDELFETRGEDFHLAITKNKEHKKLCEKIEQADNEIKEDNEHYKEFLKAFEKYEDASCEMGYLTQKLMNKFGILDGMKINLEGTKHIDIAKFLKENK